MTLAYKAYVTNKFQILAQNKQGITKCIELSFFQKHFLTFFFSKCFRRQYRVLKLYFLGFYRKLKRGYNYSLICMYTFNKSWLITILFYSLINVEKEATSLPLIWNIFPPRPFL